MPFFYTLNLGNDLGNVTKRYPIRITRAEKNRIKRNTYMLLDNWIAKHNDSPYCIPIASDEGQEAIPDKETVARFPQ